MRGGEWLPCYSSSSSSSSSSGIGCSHVLRTGLLHARMGGRTLWRIVHVGAGHMHVGTWSMHVKAGVRCAVCASSRTTCSPSAVADAQLFLSCAHVLKCKLPCHSAWSTELGLAPNGQPRSVHGGAALVPNAWHGMWEAHLCGLPAALRAPAPGAAAGGLPGVWAAPLPFTVLWLLEEVPLLLGLGCLCAVTTAATSCGPRAQRSGGGQREGSGPTHALNGCQVTAHRSLRHT